MASNDSLIIFRNTKWHENIWLLVTEYFHYRDLLNLEKSGVVDVDENGHNQLVSWGLGHMKSIKEDDKQDLNPGIIARCVELKEIIFYHPSPKQSINDERLQNNVKSLAIKCLKLEKFQVDGIDVIDSRIPYGRLMETFINNFPSNLPADENCCLRKMYTTNLSEETMIKLFNVAHSLEEIDASFRRYGDVYADLTSDTYTRRVEKWGDEIDHLIIALRRTDAKFTKLKLLKIKDVPSISNIPKLMKSFSDELCGKMTLKFSFGLIPKYELMLKAFQAIGSKHFRVLKFGFIHKRIIRHVNCDNVLELMLSTESEPNDEVVEPFLIFRKVEKLHLVLAVVDSCPIERLLHEKNFPRLRILSLIVIDYDSTPQMFHVLSKMLKQRSGVKVAIKGINLNAELLQLAINILKNENLKIRNASIFIEHEANEPDQLVKGIKELLLHKNFEQEINAEFGNVDEDNDQQILNSGKKILILKD